MKDTTKAGQGSYNRTNAKNNFLPPEPTSGHKKGNAKDMKDDPKERTPDNSKSGSKTNQYDTVDDGTKSVKRGYPERAEGNYEDNKGKSSKDSAKTVAIRKK